MGIILFAFGKSISSLSSTDSIDWELSRRTTHTSTQFISSWTFHTSFILDFGTTTDSYWVLRWACDWESWNSSENGNLLISTTQPSIPIFSSFASFTVGTILFHFQTRRYHSLSKTSLSGFIEVESIIANLTDWTFSSNFTILNYIGNTLPIGQHETSCTFLACLFIISLETVLNKSNGFTESRWWGKCSFNTTSQSIW